jgi:hypothetical protein
MKSTSLILSGFLALASGGCVVRGGLVTTAYVEPPLVEVSSGVYVVEDYNEPVFYSGGTYWLYRGNTWYSSRSHSGGWVYVDSYRVPGHVRRIDRPHRYARYRGTGVRYRSHGGRVQRDDRRRDVRRDRDDRRDRDHRSRPDRSRDHRRERRR